MEVKDFWEVLSSNFRNVTIKAKCPAVTPVDHLHPDDNRNEQGMAISICRWSWTISTHSPGNIPGTPLQRWGWLLWSPPLLAICSISTSFRGLTNSFLLHSSHPLNHLQENENKVWSHNWALTGVRGRWMKTDGEILGGFCALRVNSGRI